jgi:hypothetical protein
MNGKAFAIYFPIFLLYKEIFCTHPNPQAKQEELSSLHYHNISRSLLLVLVYSSPHFCAYFITDNNLLFD